MIADAHDLLRSLQEHEPDWAISWLIEHADPELWAPRQFIIVDELCKGSPSLAATWRAIYRLTLFYKPIGRRRFGLRLIASVGGVGRGHLGGKAGAIRTLHGLGLITVIGIGDDDTKSDHWEYEIDPARLEALSVRFVRARITAGQLVVRRRPFDAQQRDLFAALELAPDEAMLERDGARGAGDKSVEVPIVAPLGASSLSAVAPSGANARDTLAPLGATTASSRALHFAVAPNESSSPQDWHQRVPTTRPQESSLLPPAAPSGASSQADLAPNGAGLHDMRHLLESEQHVVAPTGARLTAVSATRHPSVPDWGGHVTHDLCDLAPTGSLRSIERSIEGQRESDAPSATTLTRSEQAIADMFSRAIRNPAVLAQIGQAVAAQSHPSELPRAASLIAIDTTPAAPSGEPPLPKSLLAIWEMVSKRPSSENDQAHITMLVSRYEGVTQGYSAYWLARSMLFADLCRSDDEPVKLKVINAYMKRMEGTTFSSEVLEDRNTRGEKAPSQEPPRASRGRSERRPAELPPPTLPPPTSRAPQVLPQALAAHWVIETWRQFAGAEPVITLERAQQLIERVAMRDAWEAGLSNWSTHYKGRANWTNFDALLDWYHREAVAGSKTAAAAAPVLPGTLIDYHPALSDLELSRIWRSRYSGAATKTDKQAVLYRLLAEHPLSAEQQAELGIIDTPPRSA